MAGEHRLRRVLGPVTLTALGIGAVIGAGIFVATGAAANNDGRPGPDGLLHGRRHHLHLRRAVLRRVRLDGAGGRQRLHLRLHDDGRAVRLDHRLGPGARIRRRRGHGRQRLVGLLPEACSAKIDLVLHDCGMLAEGTTINLPSGLSAARSSRKIRRVSGAASSCRPTRSSTCPPCIIVAIVTMRAGQGHPRKRRLQRPDGGHQGGRGALRHRASAPSSSTRPTGNRSPPTAGPASASSASLSAGKADARAASRVGMLAGAAIIFFAYIGFDSVSTHAEEAKNPQRDVPIGIIASLLICTVLYIAVVAVLTGMVPYDQIEQGRRRLRRASSQTGLRLGRVHHRRRRRGRHHLGAAGHDAQRPARLPGHGPRRPGAAGVLRRRAPDASARRGRAPSSSASSSASLAGLLPIDALLHLTNIGTLFAFVIVCAAVLIMRRTNPEAERPFRCPLVPRRADPGHRAAACC